jgi:secondary thiamine-phosphate synthase enzyme
VTTRRGPVNDGAAPAGQVVMRGETLVVDTRQRLELIDLTDRIMSFVHQTGIAEGLASVWSLHTTCALFINESQTALLADIERFLERMVARDEDWLHNDPEHSDCDRRNADAHLRALLLGHSLTMQVSNSDLVLGQWQRIMMAELDGPRSRSIRVQVWGVR